MIAIKRILVATDLGEASVTALQYGRVLAERCGAALCVLHVTESLLAAALAGEYADGPAQIQRDLERVAQQRADALLTDEDRRTLKAVAVTMSHGSPAAAIVEYAVAAGVDLIVLGTHGRGRLAHLFLGNVAERVVRSAPCPVLTVRHRAPERAPARALTALLPVSPPVDRMR